MSATCHSRQQMTYCPASLVAISFTCTLVIVYVFLHYISVFESWNLRCYFF